MRRGVAEICAAIGLIAVGAAFLMGSVRLGIGQASEPGPGMLPALAGGLLALLGAINLAIGWINRTRAETIEIDRPAAFKLVGATAAIVAMAMSISLVGFFAASAVMLFALFYFIGALSITRALVMAAATAGVNYVVFAIVLKVPLP